MLIFVEIITGVFPSRKNGMVVFLQCLVIVTTTFLRNNKAYVETKVCFSGRPSLFFRHFRSIVSFIKHIGLFADGGLMYRFKNRCYHIGVKA